MGKHIFEPSETGNWNVAADYSRLKIMKLIHDIDQYITIATFGTGEMVEEFMIDEDMKIKGKITALKRLLKTIKMLINNTKFAVKKDDKTKLEKHYKTLDKLEKILPNTHSKKFNQKTNRAVIKIQDEHFDFVLLQLEKIHEELLLPLNRADLIFTSVEDWDPEKLKAKITEDIIQQG